jgi:hypothetical protein
MNWDRRVDASLRWSLPVAAFAAILLGATLLLVHSPAAPPDSPLAPFLIAWGVFAGLVASFWWRRAARPLPEVESTQAGGSVPSSIDPTHRTPLVSGIGPSTSLVSGGSEWRVLAAGASPGDESWLSWLPRATRRLGTEAGGVSRGAAYSPGPSGRLVAFPTRKDAAGDRPATMPGDFARSALPSPQHPKISEEGEPTSGRPGSRGLPDDDSGAAPKRESFSEEELDRMFPPALGGRTLFLSDIPVKVGVSGTLSKAWESSADATTSANESETSSQQPSSTPEAGPVARSRGHQASDSSADVFARPDSTIHSHMGTSEHTPGSRPRAEELALEAANPVPPHLRSGGPRVRLAPHRPHFRSLDPSSQKSVCASCSKVVVNLRMSGPCPKCLRPICNECLREAFVTRGQGWCIDCASAPSVAAS